MKWRCLTLLLGILLASPAHAEKLEFDYRLYPPLKAVLDSGRSEMIRYDDSNPRYVTDRIAIQGTSADNWTEALDIIVRLRRSNMKSPADWAAEIQQRWRALCPGTFTTIAEDANSLTFVRQSANCPAGTPLTGIYRIVVGRKSLFMLNGIALGEMAEPVRQQWLEMLRSARISG